MQSSGGDVLKISLENADNSELEVVIKGDIGSKEAINVIAALNTSAFGKLLLQGEDKVSFLTQQILFTLYQSKAKPMPLPKAESMRLKKSFMYFQTH